MDQLLFRESLLLADQMHSIIQNLEVKIYVVIKFKRHKIKNHSNMFRIVCDPSPGSIELYLTEIIRSGSQMFVVCLVGVWQCNFEFQSSTALYSLMTDRIDPKHVGVIFVSFKLLYNVDFNLQVLYN